MDELERSLSAIWLTPSPNGRDRFFNSVVDA